MLNHNSGLLSIKEGTPFGTFDIRVKVTDGIWPDVVSTVKVVVKEIREEAAHNAGSIRIRGKSGQPNVVVHECPTSVIHYLSCQSLMIYSICSLYNCSLYILYITGFTECVF